MAIAVLFEFPNESVSKYDEVLEVEVDLLDQPARSHHICFETESGFTVVDVWDSAEDFERFSQLLGPVMQKVGLAGEPRVYPLHNTL